MVLLLNHFVIGPHVHFHIKRYLTDDIHFHSQRLSWVFHYGQTSWCQLSKETKVFDIVKYKSGTSI